MSTQNNEAGGNSGGANALTLDNLGKVNNALNNYQSHSDSANLLALVGAFLANVQGVFLGFTLSSNSDASAKVVNALFFIGLILDVIGTYYSLKRYNLYCWYVRLLTDLKKDMEDCKPDLERITQLIQEKEQNALPEIFRVETNPAYLSANDHNLESSSQLNQEKEQTPPRENSGVANNHTSEKIAQLDQEKKQNALPESTGDATDPAHDRQSPHMNTSQLDSELQVLCNKVEIKDIKKDYDHLTVLISKPDIKRFSSANALRIVFLSPALFQIPWTTLLLLKIALTKPIYEFHFSPVHFGIDCFVVGLIVLLIRMQPIGVWLPTLLVVVLLIVHQDILPRISRRLLVIESELADSLARKLKPKADSKMQGEEAYPNHYRIFTESVQFVYDSYDFKLLTRETELTEHHNIS